MTADEARELLAYNRWANGRMLDDVRPLAPAELARDLRTSFGSILGTIAHLYWAEWLWVRRWRGESPKRLVAPGEYATLEQVERDWTEVLAAQNAFAAGLTDERLGERIAYVNVREERWEYTLAQMIRHLVNHSTYHRGQVAALLRQIGGTPRATDLLVWIDEG